MYISINLYADSAELGEPNSMRATVPSGILIDLKSEIIVKAGTPA